MLNVVPSKAVFITDGNQSFSYEHLFSGISESKDSFSSLESRIVFYETPLTLLELFQICVRLLNGNILIPKTEATKSLLLEISNPNFWETLPTDTALIIPTSGSSGTPKLIPISWRQIFASCQNSVEIFPTTSESRALLCLPLTHIGAWMVIFRAIFGKYSVHYLPSFSVVDVTELISNSDEITHTSLVPTMLSSLFEERFTPRTSFLGILLGGGPSSESLFHKCVEKEIPVVKSFGMSETCAAISYSDLQNWKETPPRSSGKISRNVAWEIRDYEGKIMDSNQEGLLWVKGEQVFDGYFQNEAQNPSFDYVHWFCTGDFAHVDGNGYLFIHSRRSDRIVSGGENIDPKEIEIALLKISGITEARVLGIADEYWGQKLVAGVISSKNLSESEIKLELKESLLPFQIPKRILVLDKYPSNEMGKFNQTEFLKMF